MNAAPGLYIHVPFCSRRCPYCDFYSISALDLIPKYVESLAAEAQEAAKTWKKPFETLYIGGGSPSLLNPEGLRRLFKALAVFDLSQLKEITLEANPEDLLEGQADLWEEVGITRVSLGLQTLDERWLSDVLGRQHSLGQSYEAVERLKGHSYSLSFDLIYGLPGQKQEHWGEDLMKAVELGPEHISAYNLTLEPSSPLARSIKEKFLPPLPPQEMLADMFLISGQALRGQGFYRYEVSNFARPGYESLHNLKYWRRETYLGLGPSAHSFDGRKRWANVSSVRQWASAINSKAAATAFIEEPDEEAVALETIMLALRLSEGLAESYLKEGAMLEKYINSGHLIKSEGRIRPSEKGLLIADRLAVDLSAG